MEVAATAEQVTLEHCFYVAGAPKLRCGWICPSCWHYSWAVLSKPIRLQSGPLRPLAVTVSSPSSKTLWTTTDGLCSLPVTVWCSGSCEVRGRYIYFLW